MYILYLKFDYLSNSQKQGNILKNILLRMFKIANFWFIARLNGNLDKHPFRVHEHLNLLILLFH